MKNKFAKFITMVDMFAVLTLTGFIHSLIKRSVTKPEIVFTAVVILIAIIANVLYHKTKSKEGLGDEG